MRSAISGPSYLTAHFEISAMNWMKETNCWISFWHDSYSIFLTNYGSIISLRTPLLDVHNTMKVYVFFWPTWYRFLGKTAYSYILSNLWVKIWRYDTTEHAWWNTQNSVFYTNLIHNLLYPYLKISRSF